MFLKFFQIRTIAAAEFQPFCFKQFSLFSATNTNKKPAMYHLSTAKIRRRSPEM
jgi:hypothetical protein